MKILSSSNSSIISLVVLLLAKPLSVKCLVDDLLNGSIDQAMQNKAFQDGVIPAIVYRFQDQLRKVFDGSSMLEISQGTRAFKCLESRAGESMKAFMPPSLFIQAVGFDVIYDVFESDKDIDLICKNHETEAPTAAPTEAPIDYAEEQQTEEQPEVQQPVAQVGRDGQDLETGKGKGKGQKDGGRNLRRRRRLQTESLVHEMATPEYPATLATSPYTQFAQSNVQSYIATSDLNDRTDANLIVERIFDTLGPLGLLKHRRKQNDLFFETLTAFASMVQLNETLQAQINNALTIPISNGVRLDPIGAIVRGVKAMTNIFDYYVDRNIALLEQELGTLGFHDGLIDSAEIQATLRNTETLIGKINTLQGAGGGTGGTGGAGIVTPAPAPGAGIVTPAPDVGIVTPPPGVYDYFVSP